MFKNLSLRAIIVLVSGLIGLTGIGLAILLSYTVHNVGSIQTSWHEYQLDRSEKARLESVLSASIGYGGMIHEFKNYVLRHENVRVSKIQAHIGAAKAVINQYQSLVLSDVEKSALQDITTVLNAYNKALLITVDLVSRNVTAQDIDRRVKVDDSIALQGLQILRKEVTFNLRISEKRKETKGRLVEKIRSEFGFGGMIHEFKNLILRSDLPRVTKIREYIGSIEKNIAKYKVLGTSSNEDIALDNIIRTLDAYKSKLNIITKLIKAKTSISKIDSAVKINDRPALQGLKTLDKEIASQIDSLSKHVDDRLHFLATVVPIFNWGALVILLLAMGASVWIFQHYVISPISTSIALMKTVAKGDTAITIKGMQGKNEISQIARALNTFRENIIERDQGTQELRDREQRIHAILNTVIDGIITINDKGLIETFNPAAKRLFGYEELEVIGKNIKMLMPAPYHGAHDGYLKHYIETRDARVIGIGREVIGKRKDNSTFPMELSVSEMKVGENQMFTGIVRDITERKRMDLMKSEFVSTVSHELRTPLTSISGVLSLLDGGALGELSEQAKPMVEAALKNSKRLNLLINDLLDMEKIAAGKMDYDIQIQALMPLVEQALEANKSYADQHQVRFKLIERADDAEVMIDSQRMMQVLSNFMSNAAKFSPADSSIEISVRLTSTNVRVEVKDHGRGIPKEFRNRIFQKFSQADSSDTKSKGGTGLGLSITKELVEHMGGKVGFESIEEQGSTFYFELPLAHPPTEQSNLIAKAAHILIVHDDPAAAKLMVSVLSGAGYTADTINRSGQVLSLLENNHYAAMIIDLAAPDFSGLKQMHELRDKAKAINLPVMIISATIEGDQLVISPQKDNVDWLLKPVAEDELLSAITSTLLQTPSQLTRILHVEDDADLQRIIRQMAGPSFHFEHAYTVSMAKSILYREHFDIVILDIDLPDGSGWDLLPLIQEEHPPSQVLVLSGTALTAEESAKVESVLLKSSMSHQDLNAALDELTNTPLEPDTDT